MHIYMYVWFTRQVDADIMRHECSLLVGCICLCIWRVIMYYLRYAPLRVHVTNDTDSTLGVAGMQVARRRAQPTPHAPPSRSLM